MSDNRLAIDGGTPVRTIPFPEWPIHGEREEQLLLEVLHSGRWSIFNGEMVKTFQEKFAAFQGARYAVCVPNGTLALQMALMALGVRPGDEVLAPAYTFIATVSAVLMLGAKPVFVDIHPDTYTLDPAGIAAAVTPRTKVVLPVHLAGQPADLDGIRAAAHSHGLRVLEDACQAWGAEWQGRRVGAIGDLGAFSFQLSKNITAGEGGAVVTDDPELHELCWSIHNVGRSRTGAWYHHEILGWNLRMTEWQGAVLLGQIERLDEHAARRQRNAEYLRQKLVEIPGISPLPPDPRVTRHAWHLMIVRYDPGAFGGHPIEQFVSALSAEGITPISRGYVPLNHSPAIRKSMQATFGIDPAQTHLPCTERAAEHTFWLAQTVFLGDEEDMDDIAAAVRKIQRAWA